MKISGFQQNYTSVKTPGAGKQQEINKDLVVLGQNNDDNALIFQKPLGQMKAGDISPGVIYAALGAIAAGGALVSGVGILGKTLGGVPGALMATGVAAVAGGLLCGKDGNNIKFDKFLKGAAAGAALAGGGALVSGFNVPLALGAGAAGGLGFAVADIT